MTEEFDRATERETDPETGRAADRQADPQTDRTAAGETDPQTGQVADDAQRGNVGGQDTAQGAVEEQLTQTARENRVGDVGDLGNDLRLAEEQRLIEEQSHGRFPTGPGDRLREQGEGPGMDAAAEALDVPDEDLAGTPEADASDDEYHRGGTYPGGGSGDEA